MIGNYHDTANHQREERACVLALEVQRDTSPLFCFVFFFFFFENLLKKKSHSCIRETKEEKKKNGGKTPGLSPHDQFLLKATNIFSRVLTDVVSAIAACCGELNLDLIFFEKNVQNKHSSHIP